MDRNNPFHYYSPAHLGDLGSILGEIRHIQKDLISRIKQCPDTEPELEPLCYQWRILESVRQMAENRFMELIDFIYVRLPEDYKLTPNPGDLMSTTPG